jgi:23S rRNA (guanosine2251-2'-O)-methyltransferase
VIDVLYGIGPVLEALRAGRRRVHRLWIAEGRGHDRRLEELLRLARAAGAATSGAARDELTRRAAGGVHQGVVAEAEPLPRVELDTVLAAGRDRPALVVVLDSVQDPQNLGAVVRTAECAGADAVVVPKDRAASLTPAAVKAAEGAAERLPVVEVVNLARALRTMKEAGLWCVGLAAEGTRAWCEVDYRQPTAIVLGSEGSGLRRIVRETCDHLVAIPLSGRIGSLNVSVAAAVVLYESVRQRREGRRGTDPATRACTAD